MAKSQSDRPAASKPLKKTFKNVDSRLANLILNEIVDRSVCHTVMPTLFMHFSKRKKKDLKLYCFHAIILQWRSDII